jgi:hypothetical protein
VSVVHVGKTASLTQRQLDHLKALQSWGGWVKEDRREGLQASVFVALHRKGLADMNSGQPFKWRINEAGRTWLKNEGYMGPTP